MVERILRILLIYELVMRGVFFFTSISFIFYNHHIYIKCTFPEMCKNVFDYVCKRRVYWGGGGRELRQEGGGGVLGDTFIETIYT